MGDPHAEERDPVAEECDLLAETAKTSTEKVDPLAEEAKIAAEECDPLAEKTRIVTVRTSSAASRRLWRGSVCPSERDDGSPPSRAGGTSPNIRSMLKSNFRIQLAK